MKRRAIPKSRGTFIARGGRGAKERRLKNRTTRGQDVKVLSLYESFITAYSVLRNPRSQSADLPLETPVRF